MAKVLALKVEGIGNADGSYRFFHGSQAPGSAQDPDGLWHRALHIRPVSTGWQLDIAQWVITQDGITFQLKATDLVKEMFWTPHPLVATRALDDDTVAVHTEDDMSDQVIWWSTREAMLMGTMVLDGGGGYTDATPTRGYLNTVEKPLKSYTDGDFVGWDQPMLIKDRKAWLVTLELDGTSTEQVEWSGVITEITSDRPGIVSVQCDSILAWLEAFEMGGDRRRMRMTGPAKTITDSDGRRVDEGGAYSHTSVYSSDGLDSNHEWIASLGGKGLVKFRDTRKFHPDQQEAGQITTWPRGPQPDYAKPPKDIWQCYPTATIPQNQESGAPPDNKSLPFSSNRFDLALQLLQTGPDPDGPNGTHDLGIKGMGCNIHSSNINVAAFTALAQYYGPVAPVLALVLCEKKENTPIFDFINKELFEAVDCMLVPDPLTGFVDVISLHPLPALGDVLTTIEQYDLVTGKYPAQRVLDITVDSVQVVHSNIPGWGPTGTKVNDVTVRSRNVRRTVGIPLNWDGIDQGDTVYANGGGPMGSLALEYIQRRHFPYPYAVVTIKDQARTKLLKPGQRVSVTHPKIYSARSGQGVTNTIFTVVGGRRGSATWEYDLVNLNARVIGGQFIGQALYAAATGGGATVTISAGEFTNELGGPFDLDYLAIEVDDVLTWARYEDLAVQSQAGVVASASLTTVVFDSAPAYAHRVGDILITAPADEATAAQRLRWTWQADTANEIDGDDPNRWS